MHPSLKSPISAALLSAASLSAQATLYDFTYTASFARTVGSTSSTLNLVFSGALDGTLQADGNTVLVADLISLNIDGQSSTSLGTSGAASVYVATGNFNAAGTLTLDGSYLNLVATDDAALLGVYLEMYSAYPGMTVYFAPPGSTYREYNTVLPLNSSWSMTVNNSPVPEPASPWLLLAGVPVLLAWRRRALAARA